MLVASIVGLGGMALAGWTVAAWWRGLRLDRAIDELRSTIALVERRLVIEAGAAASRWWTVLGLGPAASPAEVDAAYRAELKQAHPDLGGRGGSDRIAQLRRARQAGLDRRPGRRA